jgi:probable F420-dependent oxidoreductase
VQLGRVGIFSPELRLAERAECRGAVAELDALGYGAFWIPGGPDGSDIINVIGDLLGPVGAIVGVAAVLNVWVREAADVAANHAAVAHDHPDRFVLGLGASHANFVEPRGQKYEKIPGIVRNYLDELDAADPPVPKQERMLAGLGPQMLALARDRTAGSIPYLFTPEHTQWARDIVGPGPLLAPDIAVFLGDDAGLARIVGRRYLARYLDRRNYTNTLRRQGFTDDDFAAGGSDRLVDAVLAWGDVEKVGARVEAHRDAGADHVSIQVLLRDEDYTVLPLDEWRHLASLIDRT